MTAPRVWDYDSQAAFTNTGFYVSSFSNTEKKVPNAKTHGKKKVFEWN